MSSCFLNFLFETEPEKRTCCGDKVFIYTETCFIVFFTTNGTVIYTELHVVLQKMKDETKESAEKRQVMKEAGLQDVEYVITDLD